MCLVVHVAVKLQGADAVSSAFNVDPAPVAGLSMDRPGESRCLVVLRVLIRSRFKSPRVGRCRSMEPAGVTHQDLSKTMIYIYIYIHVYFT